MSIDPLAGGGGYQDGAWSDLGAGAPTLAAFARLCSAAMSGPEPSLDGLSAEAKAILYAARQRGVLEIKGANDAFEAAARFLAVRVALDADRWMVFRSREDPTVTIRFLDAFRELCAAGFVLHHIYRDFSLTRKGFELAQSIPPEEIQETLTLGSELSSYETGG